GQSWKGLVTRKQAPLQRTQTGCARFVQPWFEKARQRKGQSPNGSSPAPGWADEGRGLDPMSPRLPATRLSARSVVGWSATPPQSPGRGATRRWSPPPVFFFF